MILEGSRYQGGSVETLPDRHGTYQVGVQRASYVVSTVVRTIVVAEDDRLDHIAHKEYGDATLWWAIADANPTIMWFDRIPPGTLLRIPGAPVR